jgi:hypothetical protein
VEQADFRYAAEEARGAINAWVAEETLGKIRDILSPGSVDQLTKLVLADLRAPCPPQHPSSVGGHGVAARVPFKPVHEAFDNAPERRQQTEASFVVSMKDLMNPSRNKCRIGACTPRGERTSRCNHKKTILPTDSFQEVKTKVVPNIRDQSFEPNAPSWRSIARIL